jgi:hypothetical protein
MYRLLVVTLVAFGVSGFSVAEGEKAEKETAPSTVVRVFWRAIEKGDVDGALALFAFSGRTKALIPRQRATFAMWSKVMKKGGTVVTVGPAKTVGGAAAVLMTSREGRLEPRRDVMYLVRKDGEWRILAYAIPGDSPAHELGKDAAAAMKSLKEWARGELKEKREK